MAAKIMTIDFKKTPNVRQHASGKLRDKGNAATYRPMTEDGRLLTPKQIRARARRAAAKKGRKGNILSNIEFETLYKPVDEWDIEELSQGRPRNISGDFRGPKPKWVTREVHERAMEVFRETIQAGVHGQAPQAIETLKWVMSNHEQDERGKPVVPASAKNQASMFVIEHVIGKPKQVVEQDISVKLQGILGAVMVNPNDAGGFDLAHTPGRTLEIGVEGEIEDAEIVDEDEDEITWE